MPGLREAYQQIYSQPKTNYNPPRTLNEAYSIILQKKHVITEAVSLSPSQIEKPYPQTHDFFGKYNDRGERFLEKILNKEKIELNNGDEVVVDINKSSKAIEELKNKNYRAFANKKIKFVTTDGEAVSLSDFAKTPEFGAGSGSGAGAAQTAIQESSTAVVCGIAFGIIQDKISLKHLTPELIKQSYHQYSNVSSALEEVTQFILSKKDWQTSLISSANLLLSEFPQSRFIFHRGSSLVDSIYSSFKRAKKISNINIANDKWNPADIWMVSPELKNVNIEGDISDVNHEILQLFLQRKLIGVSLKKISGSGKITYANISEKDKQGYTFEGFDSRPTNNNTILKASDAKITLRTFNYATNFAGEIMGKTAAHGKIGLNSINDILIDNTNQSAPSTLEAKQAFQNIDMNSDIVADFFVIYNNIVEKIDQTQFTETVLTKDLNWLVSKYISTKIADIIINQPQNIQNSIISDILRYASSELKQSSVFVKIS